MKNKFFLIGITVVLSIVSCTQQERAKNFGGSMKIDLPKGRKLINVTWKERNNLWYLTRTMTSQDSVETYTFQEKSSWDIMEGAITIQEYK